MLQSLEDRQTRPEVQKVHDMMFDFVLDTWDPNAAELQTTGDLIHVALPRGFYGGCPILSQEKICGTPPQCSSRSAAAYRT